MQLRLPSLAIAISLCAPVLADEVSPQAPASAVAPSAASLPADRCASGAPGRCLKLFELEVQHAPRQTLAQAIVRTGGKQQPSQNPNIDNFVVTEIGLPGLKTLEVVYHGSKFVLASYHSGFSAFDDKFASTSERLRKMLVEKYGVPFIAPGDKSLVGARLTQQTPKFAEPYHGSGRHAWPFADGMWLVYKEDFMMRRIDLTYIDPVRFEALRKEAELQDQNATRSEVDKKANAF